MKTQQRYSVEDVLVFLEEHGNAAGKEVLKRHGAREPFFGTRIGDMKKLTRKIKKDHDLAIKLYKTGNSDAMYFASLIADETQITRETLQAWVRDAYWYLLAETAVADVAAESPYGHELALEWMDAPEEMIATAGWATYAALLSTRPNEEFDDAEVSALLDRIEETIHDEQNRVRYAMNAVVIAAGAYLPQFTDRAKAMGDRIGKVHVDMGGTACKVPVIRPYIEKIEARGTIGKKRPQARC